MQSLARIGENPQLSFEFERRAPEEVFARIHRLLRPRSPIPQFRVEYCEWAQVRSSIQGHPWGFSVRISDVIRDAPPAALEALAEILICGALRMKPSREARACYLAGIMSPAVVARANQARRERGYKFMRPAKGGCFDLQAIFDKLNQQYFQGTLRIRHIGWTINPARTVLGRHDPAHESIVISRALDRPAVSALLVEFIVYHEMLHVRHPVKRSHHRRLVHPPEFRAAEKKFSGYTRAQKLLKSGRWGAQWE
ncbi:MAG: M48 family peptidase [Terriglobia bacterium]